jgi:hypothetical protein
MPVFIVKHSFRACPGFSRRVKNGSFFAVFQLRSPGFTPSKMQKLAKNTLFLPLAENPEQAPGPR